MSTPESSPEHPPAGPRLRVVSGDATPEEIAAIVAVLTAASGEDAAAPPTRRSLWTDSARVPGSRLSPGPGAWRASALPR